jgi:hypothetical protein
MTPGGVHAFEGGEAKIRGRRLSVAASPSARRGAVVSTTRPTVENGLRGATEMIVKTGLFFPVCEARARPVLLAFS